MPETVWSKLSIEQQFAVAAELCRRRRNQFSARYTNLISVGVGYRTKTGHAKPLREVCIRFLVRKKWRSARNVPGAIPKYISAYVDFNDGSRKRCLIPTDVDILGKGKPGAGADLTSGVVARQIGGSEEINGAAFCLVSVSTDPTTKYLMGCHHVFTRSLTHACAPQKDTELRDLASGETLGRLAMYALLTEAVEFGVDAALVRLDNSTIDALNLWGKAPTRLAGEFDVPNDYQIYAPAQAGLGRTAPLSADFVALQFDINLPYGGGKTVRIKTAIESRSTTIGGDSGSPLIGGDGTLFGMHFYGTDHGTSLAIPVVDLFRPDVFLVSIDLAN